MRIIIKRKLLFLFKKKSWQGKLKRQESENPRNILFFASLSPRFPSSRGGPRSILLGWVLPWFLLGRTLCYFFCRILNWSFWSLRSGSLLLSSNRLYNRLLLSWDCSIPNNRFFNCFLCSSQILCSRFPSCCCFFNFLRERRFLRIPRGFLSFFFLILILLRGFFLRGSRRWGLTVED